jgi:hypothetical protein
LRGRLSHALTYSLAGERATSQAYMNFMLRALHQVAADAGIWDVASLLLLGQDLCKKDAHGLTERDLATIASYQDAVKKIQPANRYGGNGENSEQERDGTKDGGKGAGENKQK